MSCKKAEVVDNPAFSKCIQYNSWIESQRKTFTNEYLDNVSNFTSQTVDKYFSTKEHPQGRDPRLTYRHSKLDCDIYNPASKKFQKELVEKAPTNRSQSPGASSTRKESLEKDGSSVPNRNDRIEKEKPDVYKSPKPKSTTPNYQIHAPSKTQTDGTHPGQDTHVRPKAPASADSRNEGKTEATATQSEPPTNGPTTAQDKSPPQAGNPLLPAVVTKDHDKPLHSTTAVTSATTHSTETLPAPSVAISTLPQPQPPALNTPPDVTAAQGHGTHPSSSASTVTTTATTTTMSPLAVTSPTMSATHKPISSAKEATSVSSSQEPSLLSAESAPKATAPTTRPQQTFTQTPTSLREGDTKGVSVPAQPDTIDNNQQTKLSGAPSPKTKDLIIQPEVQPANSISTHSAYTPSGGHFVYIKYI
ncbi:hypothetical protein POVWA1_082150 [Plasmodium ovale wallikeri]|uniref:PIR Superfamily Protein n=1 Tax=Plasmodium ovale wallikeri TaxID=864142 RepID=A0A1A9AMU4_PLAOA|nr:hypothetical protein POVWA1_082150 [Plasmodium ovale wallikeri]